LLDAGCGAGIEAGNLQRLAPGLKIHGVDISSVSLADAALRSEKTTRGRPLLAPGIHSGRIRH